jgi:hypothetical protein
MIRIVGNNIHKEPILYFNYIMGDYLATPIKTKDSSDGENSFVHSPLSLSYALDAVVCRVGERTWKTLI